MSINRNNWELFGGKWKGRILTGTIAFALFWVFFFLSTQFELSHSLIVLLAMAGCAGLIGSLASQRIIKGNADRSS
ncbi:hypothetical protein [Bradyrhizobium sp. HKCCYLS3013]|uniref:hypothetical protein n=1 Tax=Bradyrhizobium sp. HKCCYLS3013 TaxID=3420735 RepID=UPI003EC095B6